MYTPIRQFSKAEDRMVLTFILVWLENNALFMYIHSNSTTTLILAMSEGCRCLKFSCICAENLLKLFLMLRISEIDFRSSDVDHEGRKDSRGIGFVRKYNHVIIFLLLAVRESYLED